MTAGIYLLDELEAHLWIANLDLLSRDYSFYYRLLSSQEQLRAEKFAFDHLKIRFVISHGILRVLLQNYSGLENNAICFSLGVHGKPFLNDNNAGLQFNLAHSGNLAVMGFTKGKKIGVDIEYVHKEDLEHGIENYVFSNHEKNIFKQLNCYEKKAAFFNAWTRKEALLKGIGTGLSDPLDTIEVSFLPSEKPQAVKIGEKYAQSWSLEAFNVGSDYVGAVAIESKMCSIRTHIYSVVNSGCP